MSEHHDAHNAHASHHHISPASLYWSVWVGLMVLTVITVLAYYIPLWLNVQLGAANIIIAMAIATTKASLVVLFFMGLKYDKKFHLIAFLSSLIFLGLFLGFTLLDINTREDAPAFAKPLYTPKVSTGAGHGAAAGEHAAPATDEHAAPTGTEHAAPASGEHKEAEAKPAEHKTGETKPSEGKPAEAKAAAGAKH